jgi:hypothetical protein
MHRVNSNILFDSCVILESGSLRIETNGTSFRLEMMLQLLRKKTGSESSSGRVCDVSVDSDVLSMHKRASR